MKAYSRLCNFLIYSTEGDEWESCSDGDDDDDDGEWVDVKHSSDEEEQVTTNDRNSNRTKNRYFSIS